jgi:hypothetical protein
VTNRLANTEVAHYRLYNLDSDPEEKNNLATVNPEVFDRMQTQLAKIIEDGRSRF